MCGFPPLLFPMSVRLVQAFRWVLFWLDSSFLFLRTHTLIPGRTKVPQVVLIALLALVFLSFLLVLHVRFSHLAFFLRGHFSTR